MLAGLEGDAVDHTSSPRESGDPAARFACAHGYASTQEGLRSDLALPLPPRRHAGSTRRSGTPHGCSARGTAPALKLANLARLRAELPEVSSVRTFNARSNEPMLRVNRALGFEVTGYLTEWEKALDRPGAAEANRPLAAGVRSLGQAAGAAPRR